MNAINFWPMVLRIVGIRVLCKTILMQITVTKRIEEFIARRLTKGYSDPSEVARQAFLRWMEDEEFDPAPPHLAEKLEEARQGKFRAYNPQTYEAMMTSANEDRKSTRLNSSHVSESRMPSSA